MKNKFKTVWISDTHIGAQTFHAKELLEFLKHIECEKMFLVGDIVDIWQMRRKVYWSQECNEVLRKLIKISRNTEVVYIPGNHDELMRDFCSEKFGNISWVLNSEHITLDGKKFLVTHGDQFDMVIQNSWMTYLGCMLYDYLISFNKFINHLRAYIGLSSCNFSAYVKQKTKQICIFVSNYERVLSEEAKIKHYDGVICGHIHHAVVKDINGIVYCNPGDWIENCTALVETLEGELKVVSYKDICRETKTATETLQ